ncbi:MAG TPA: fibronectin type III domain-containing protein, partial [Steroidobacteraceae bacterium]|nr:fibronectin type III domain-containing protein [Steroidobacteraceae bacterium]
MRKSARNAAGLATSVLALLLAACGGSGDDDPPVVPPPAADTTAPSVPGGVTASAQGSTEILVSWTVSTDAGSGVAGYHVFRNGGAAAIATVTATSYTDSVLTPSTAYTYTVSAFDAATPANESALSGAAAATTGGGTPPVGGLDARPANATCLAGDPPGTNVSIAVQPVFTNLPEFTQPIAMLQEPGNSARWYVVQKTGSVRVFDNTPNVSTTREFINLAGKLNSDPSSDNDERGLLGMAFHPNYPTDPRVYFFYTGTDTTLGLVDRVSQFRLAAGGT